MNQTGIRAALVGVVLLVVLLIALSSGGDGSSPPMMDGRRLIAAAQAYANAAETNGLARPSSVKVEALVATGLLTGNEAKGFQGMDVTVYLFERPAKADDVVIEAALADGGKVVMHADGTVHEFDSSAEVVSEEN